MAEAIVALSLASNIVQIVTFTADVISKTKDLAASSSSVPVKVEWIESTASRNKDLATELEIQTSTYAPPSQADEAVAKLAKRCIDESSKLLELLNSLKIAARPDGTVSKWQAGKKVLKSSIKNGEIEASSQRLERLEIQLCALLLQRINYSQAIEYQELKKCVQTTNQCAVQVITDNAERILQTLEDSRQTQQAILGKLNYIEDLLVYTGDRSRVDVFLELLRFPQMEERRIAIAERSYGTFEWMLTGSGKTFGAWLLSHEAMFWICGEPGSGKSVLMKTLRQHHRTRDLIQRSPAFGQLAEVAIADYYFWLAGHSPLQKNVVGMLRAVIYQLIESYPGLLKKLPVITQQTWSSARLTRIDLLQILRQIAAHIQILLFIDGLDECEGSPIRLAELSEDVASLTSSCNIRACISSRPSKVFEHMFGSLTFQIRLQELTRMDCFFFIRNALDSRSDLFPEKLWTDVHMSLLARGFQRFGSANYTNAEKDACKVIEQLVWADEQSNFLWLSLVLDAICERLANGAQIREIIKHINEMPRKLEEYYMEQVLDRINDTYFHETATAFKLYTICSRNFGFVFSGVFWHLYQSFVNSERFHHEAGYGAAIDFQEYSPTQLQAMHAATNRWLQGCCRGFLQIDQVEGERDYRFPEVVVSPKHRTVHDFLMGPQVQAICNERLAAHFLESTILEDTSMVILKTLRRFTVSKDTAKLYHYTKCSDIIRDNKGHVPEVFRNAFTNSFKLPSDKDSSDDRLERLLASLLSSNWQSDINILTHLLCLGEEKLVTELLGSAPELAVVALSDDENRFVNHPLSFAISPPCSCDPAPATSIRLLLRYGADPNCLTAGRSLATVWHELLTLVFEWWPVRHIEGSVDSKGWRKFAKDACVAFIEHGADLNSLMRFENHDCMSPLHCCWKELCKSKTECLDACTILHATFDDEDQEELDSLIKYYSKAEVQQRINELRRVRLERCQQKLRDDRYYLQPMWRDSER